MKKAGKKKKIVGAKENNDEQIEIILDMGNDIIIHKLLNPGWINEENPNLKIPKRNKINKLKSKNKKETK